MSNPRFNDETILNEKSYLSQLKERTKRMNPFAKPILKQDKDEVDKKESD